MDQLPKEEVNPIYINVSSPLILMKGTISKEDSTIIDFIEDSYDECELGTDTNKVVRVAETDSQFPGSFEAFYKIVDRELRYPNEAENQRIEGKVIIRFIVEKMVVSQT